jgi:hypothetical protein
MRRTQRAEELAGGVQALLQCQRSQSAELDGALAGKLAHERQTGLERAVFARRLCDQPPLACG